MFEEGNRLRAIHGAEKVVDLSLGNPEVEPPAAFLDALARVAADRRPGLHRYMPNAGYLDVREAVAAELSRESGQPVRADDVIMSVGAAGGLNVVLKAILEPGEEVIVLVPYFPEYDFYIDHAAGVPRYVKLRRDFRLDLDAIEAALAPSVRALLICHPGNPTGRLFSREEVAALADLLRRRAPHVYLVSDEPYKKLLFDGKTYPPALGAYEKTIVVGSHSKDLALPGERIGFIAFSPEIDEADRRDLFAGMVFLTRTLGFVNAPALLQRAVKEFQAASVDPAIYQERRDLLCGALARMGYDFETPDGAFYLFPRVPDEDDVRFVKRLSEKLVLTVPGSGFGAPGHIRVSYCVARETIERSFDGFAAIAREYGLTPR
jgi:aspartate aminotransferase